MNALLAVLKPLEALNGAVLAAGRVAGAAFVGLMVLAILIQVFFRYVLNNALPWPDEAARFAMLWMAGLMAPSAFRSGGFVAIDLVSRLLPWSLPRLLGLALLSVSLLTLATGLRIGWSEVTGFGGSFATASLYVPVSPWLDEWHRVPRSWMMSSLLVGVALLIMVNVELILRQLVEIAGGGDRLASLPADPSAGPPPRDGSAA